MRHPGTHSETHRNIFFIFFSYFCCLFLSCFSCGRTLDTPAVDGQHSKTRARRGIRSTHDRFTKTRWRPLGIRWIGWSALTTSSRWQNMHFQLHLCLRFSRLEYAESPRNEWHYLICERSIRRVYEYTAVLPAAVLPSCTGPVVPHEYYSTQDRGHVCARVFVCFLYPNSLRLKSALAFISTPRNSVCAALIGTSQTQYVGTVYLRYIYIHTYELHNKSHTGRGTLIFRWNKCTQRRCGEWWVIPVQQYMIYRVQSTRLIVCEFVKSFPCETTPASLETIFRILHYFFCPTDPVTKFNHVHMLISLGALTYYSSIASPYCFVVCTINTTIHDTT